MLLHDRIAALHELGRWVESHPDVLEIAVLKSMKDNPWFTRQNIELSLCAIAEKYLEKDKLLEWTKTYDFEDLSALNIGVIAAGNIPLVGIHDLICVFVSGASAKVKLSAKDAHLIPAFIEQLIHIFPQAAAQLHIVDKITGVEAVIATGSDNTSRYFKSYFGHLPNIIRKNRNSVAILTGSETVDDMIGLAKDIFSYFGLGCRNVSMLHVPEGYDFTPLIEVFKSEYPLINDHPKYRNNYEYNLACSMLNNDQLIVSEPVLLYKRLSLLSRIATLHYWPYKDLNEVKNWLDSNRNSIQCVVGAAGARAVWHDMVEPGQAQQPALSDYADGVDTLAFINNLNQPV
ncbi:MAG: acyl-CoA reductase [Saprospirales bacterium]|nr:MAG: acyl-CoA reductase [Saprospirales bacterium]